MSETATGHTRKAFAKINLSLEVIGKRSDGYHDLVSVMQTVTLSDLVSLTPAESVELSLSGRPVDATANLAERAALLMRRYTGLADGCRIVLHKNVPVAAGLGGGSADAAAVLLALRDLWNLALGCSAMVDLALELGSDVPFFLWGGTALIEGRGEHVTPILRCRPAWYLLVNPGFAVSTAAVFSELDRSEWGNGDRTRSLARALPRRTLSGPNSLKDALFRIAPAARDCFEALDATAPWGAHVSGSGPTIFARYSSRKDAEAARNAVKGCETHVVRARPEPTEFSPCVN